MTQGDSQTPIIGDQSWAGEGAQVGTYCSYRAVERVMVWEGERVLCVWDRETEVRKGEKGATLQ